MTQSPAPGEPRRVLRRQLRDARVMLPASTRIAAAEAVLSTLRQHPAFFQPGYVAGYWACAGELPLHAVQMGLSPQQVWCLPLIHEDGSLRFAPWRAGDPLRANRFGIPEPDCEPAVTLAPEAMSLVLLPLLGFDRRGHRLGTGGGYYDRSFAFRQHAPGPPHLIGIGYASQEVAELPRAHWDVDVDAIVTERELILAGVGIDAG